MSLAICGGLDGLNQLLDAGHINHVNVEERDGEVMACIPTDDPFVLTCLRAANDALCVYCTASMLRVGQTGCQFGVNVANSQILGEGEEVTVGTGVNRARWEQLVANHKIDAPRREPVKLKVEV